jgi:hypothetical protein
MIKQFTMWLTVATLLAGCDKAQPPQWMRITQGDPCPAAPSGATPAPACKGTVFFLDTAAITPKAGLLYVTLQTRSPGDAAGEYGIIHAEANCSSKRLEPSALHEERFSKAGQKLEMRLTPTTAEEEAAIVSYACTHPGK